MNDKTISILTREDLAGLRKPTGEALGLPGRAYFDSAFYAAERQHVLAAGWMAAGFASDIPNAGDVMPVSVAGWELVLVRGRDGAIQCFHNVCRHRGMKVVGQACNARTLSCPYHRWTYDLNGKLMGTPAVGGVNINEAPEIDKQHLGLLPVRSGQWFDFIFVNIDGKASTLEEHLRPVRERIEPTFDLTQVHRGTGGRSGTREYPVNWKVVLEGSIEDYHLPYVHKAFKHSTEYYTEDGGDIYAGFSSKRDLAEARQRYGAEDDAGLSLPTFPAMERSGKAETVVLFLFPNAILSCTPSYVSTSIMLPQGPEEVRYSARTHFINEGATDARFQKLREDNAAFWNEVFDEDDGMWKTIQSMSHVREEIGLKTRFSPHWERALHGFQKYLAKRLER
jgi:choline monooxygenase